MCKNVTGRQAVVGSASARRCRRFATGVIPLDGGTGGIGIVDGDSPLEADGRFVSIGVADCGAGRSDAERSLLLSPTVGARDGGGGRRSATNRSNADSRVVLATRTRRTGPRRCDDAVGAKKRGGEGGVTTPKRRRLRRRKIDGTGRGQAMEGRHEPVMTQYAA